MKTENSYPPGVAVSLQELIQLRYVTSGFSFLPKQPVKSLLAGKYGSRLRGRGLNFEEIRQYRPGDDIRNMDWKVTARTGKPHTRVYTEERDRPVVTLVDQRLSMLFGSKVNMKSVTAAQLGALSLWKAMQDHDRVGALIFNDTAIKGIRPHRSQKNMISILSQFVSFGQQLIENPPPQTRAQALNEALEKVANHRTHDYLYLLISDFWGIDEDSYRLAKKIVKNNDLVLFLVHDPVAAKLPEKGRITITDGSNKIDLDSGYDRLKKKIPEVLHGRLNQLVQELSMFGVPVLAFNTVDKVSDQLTNLLSQGRVHQTMRRTG
jgi:uncharacterized protein (DUF58 family)